MFISIIKNYLNDMKCLKEKVKFHSSNEALGRGKNKEKREGKRKMFLY
jgi:hypothetical protein